MHAAVPPGHGWKSDRVTDCVTGCVTDCVTGCAVSDCINPGRQLEDRIPSRCCSTTLDSDSESVPRGRAGQRKVSAMFFLLSFGRTFLGAKVSWGARRCGTVAVIPIIFGQCGLRQAGPFEPALPSKGTAPPKNIRDFPLSGRDKGTKEPLCQRSPCVCHSA